MISEQVHAIIKIHAIAVHKHLSVASSLTHKSVKKRYLDIYFLGSCRGDALKKKKESLGCGSYLHDQDFWRRLVPQ